MAEPWESDPIAEEQPTPKQPWEQDPVVEQAAPPSTLTNVASMKSGVAEMSPEARSAAIQVVQAIPDVVHGAEKGQQFVMNPASVVSEALTPKLADFMRQGLVSPEAVDTARQAAQYPAQTLSNIFFGTKYQEQGALADAGKFVSRQVAAQTTPENIALIAGTEGLGALEKGLAKKAPSLLEALFGRGNREAAALTTETAKAVEPAIKIPPVPKEYEIPQLMGSPTFTLVPEPKPEIAPSRNIVETARYQPASRPGEEPPLAQGAFPSISQGAEEARRATRTVETGVQSETARVGGEPNASQVTSPESVSQPEVRTPVGEGTPLRQPGETAAARQGTETPALEVKKEEVAPEVPPEKVQPGEFGQKGYTAVDTADQPALSRIANRHTEERAAAGELGQIAPGQGYSKMDLVKQGEKMSPEEVNQHISDLVQKTGDPIKQASAVSVEEARLSKRSADLSRASAADPKNVEAKLAADNAFKDLTDFHNGPVARLKEVFHGTGEGLQGEVPVDLSTVNGLREAYFKDTGKLPTAAMDKNFESTAARVSKSIEQDNGARTALSAEIEKQSASRKLPSPDEVRNRIREKMGLEPCQI